MNENQKFKTFALTIRPRNGIDNDGVAVVAEWVKKRSTHYHIVTEKEGSAKHLHLAMYLKTEITRSNMCTLVTRLVKKIGLDGEEQCVTRKGVRILYSNDFVAKYLDKDDDTYVVASCLPEMGTLLSWYPPKPVQVGDKKVHKHSKYYWELEALWKEHKRPIEEVNTVNIRNFLFKMMYSQRLIPVIKDDRQITQVARHLTRWINRAEECTFELAPFEVEE